MPRPPRMAAVILACTLLSCATPAPGALTNAERRGIADTLRASITAAYDLSRPGNPVDHLMSLYPDTGRVISASGGVVTTSRDSIQAGIRAFWENVGRNMRDPRWMWDSVHVDVLSRDAAALTASYHVPHITPAGQPHVIAGAWTAVFQRRSGRWVVIQEHLSDVRQ
ncbi:MAG: DUF4440 domain-containing protein [Gemmatimonadaceae bacterium]